MFDVTAGQKEMKERCSGSKISDLYVGTLDWTCGTLIGLLSQTITNKREIFFINDTRDTLRHVEELQNNCVGVYVCT